MTGTDPIASAREKRSALQKAMQVTEHAVARPAQEPSWLPELIASLLKLEEAFVAHVDEVEAADGIIAQILVNAPRLQSAAEKLRSEHKTICETLRGVLAHVGDSPDVSYQAEATKVRDEVMQLLGQLALHRQEGADLVYEAFSVDIGGTG